MDDMSFQLFKLRNSGYCCTQILVKMALDAEEKENSDVMKAVNGLCMGIGGMQMTCGLLTGGIAILGLYAGKGKDSEQPHPEFFNMVAEYTDWFEEEFGSTECKDIIGECSMAEYKSNQSLLSKCGDMLIKCYVKLQEILSEYDFEFGDREEV
jgi:C_GCAxxG_C_C family probable redox protein